MNKTISYHDKKYDIGKAPLYQGLVKYFPNALSAVAQISAYGYEKYGSWGGWRDVPDAKERYTNALLRHLTADAKGETIDPESRKRHLEHVAWNALALIELSEIEND